MTINYPNGGGLISGPVTVTTTSTGERWKFCHSCGTKVGDEWKYCADCGRQVGHIAAPYVWVIPSAPFTHPSVTVYGGTSTYYMRGDEQWTYTQREPLLPKSEQLGYTFP